jgi:hypothetical protein
MLIKMSKRKGTLVHVQRQKRDFIVFDDSNKENEDHTPNSAPNRLSPGSRERQVDKLLPKLASKNRPLILSLIDRIQEGSHYSAQEVANLRLLSDFAKAVRPLVFIPQNIIDTFAGFAPKASTHARNDVLASDQVLAGLPDPRAPKFLLSKA